MNKKKNILMCLEQLNIGGVETAVMTYCFGYMEKGHKVYIAAKNGIFTPKLEKNNIKILEIEYELINHFPLEKKDKMIEFCKNNNITEIHIHQYPCALYWLPICLEFQIPYIAYIHSIVPGTPKWFMETYPVYNIALPLFFNNASKIICIAESTQNEINELFHIKQEKFKIVSNLLNISELSNNPLPENITTFGIMSRLSKEKMKSIQKAIEFFLEYNKIQQDSKLLIAGDGPEKKEINNLIKGNKNIKMIGVITNPLDLMTKIDVFMGVDRCILEAIASKRIAIVSGYNETVNIVNKENIEKLRKENFSGKNLEKSNITPEILNKYEKEEIHKIIEENFENIDKKNNVTNNLYIEELEKTNYIDTNFFTTINKFIEGNVDTNDAREELQKIYNSKIWKIINKLAKIIKK